MAFDGIVTKCVVNELNKIVGYKIDKVYEPDKNTVILGLYGNGSNINMLFCTSHNNCRLHLTSHPYKNPATAPNFCMLLRKHLIGFKIKKIYSQDLERVVFIDVENEYNTVSKKIIVELMGKHSNIILTDNNGIIIDSLRHTNSELNSNRDMYPNAKYIFPESSKYSFLELKDFEDFYLKLEPKLSEYIMQSQDLENLEINNFMLDKIISNTFNGISSSFISHIINELSIKDISKSALKEIYNKINLILEFNNLEIFVDENKKDYYLSNGLNEQNFNINYALDDFYYKKEQNQLFKDYKNSILNLILETLKKYEKRLVNIDSKILECKDKEKYKLYGELITANLYKIPNKNCSTLELENYYNNNELITIPLDNKYTPSHNAKLFFKKYTKLKNALEIVNTQKFDTINDINYIESIIYELEQALNIKDIDDIYIEISESPIFEYKLKKKKSKTKKAKLLTTNKTANFNPLKYTINGYTILVGRNNKENDYLTCKYAKKWDLWFHTKDIPGSHVILKTIQNETTPEDIILEAAKLAAKHSKAKNSSHTPVDYCKVSFVKKPNGSKPGYVIYRNNTTVYINN